MPDTRNLARRAGRKLNPKLADPSIDSAFQRRLAKQISDETMPRRKKKGVPAKTVDSEKVDEFNKPTAKADPKKRADPKSPKKWQQSESPTRTSQRNKASINPDIEKKRPPAPPIDVSQLSSTSKRKSPPALRRNTNPLSPTRQKTLQVSPSRRSARHQAPIATASLPPTSPVVGGRPPRTSPPPAQSKTPSRLSPSRKSTPEHPPTDTASIPPTTPLNKASTDTPSIPQIPPSVDASPHLATPPAPQRSTSPVAPPVDLSPLRISPRRKPSLPTQANRLPATTSTVDESYNPSSSFDVEALIRNATTPPIPLMPVFPPSL